LVPHFFQRLRGKTEKKWNSGTQDVTDAKQRPGKQKRPTRKFAAESNLMLSHGGLMEAEQSIKNEN
jgi:hypothetical protein